ncbi:MAG: rRNA maturation RNase YbeY [Chloroflexota bacterium]
MSVYVVDIQNEQDFPGFPTERVVDAIRFVLTRHEVEPGMTLTVVVTDDEHVQQLNNEYRDVDAPTDILSFPADPLPEEIDEEAPYLGDLIIAYPYTAHQSAEAGHALSDELVLLVVHGTLHLLGYDHDNAENQDAMWSEQAYTLASLDIPVAIDVPRFTFGDDVVT